jgi:hypothetical protein
MAIKYSKIIIPPNYPLSYNKWMAYVHETVKKIK